MSDFRFQTENSGEAKINNEIISNRSIHSFRVVSLNKENDSKN